MKNKRTAEHITRFRKADKLSSRIACWEVLWERKLRRPAHSWKRNIKIDHGEAKHNVNRMIISYSYRLLLKRWRKFSLKEMNADFFQGWPATTSLVAACTCFVSAFGSSHLFCRPPIIDPHRKSMGRPTAWSEGVQVTAPVQASWSIHLF